MRPNLIILNGAPGTGKSTCSQLLLNQLEDSVWLDGDDVWRVRVFDHKDKRFPISYRNVISVLRNYISAPFRHVILSWILPDDESIRSIVDGISDLPCNVYVFTLQCSAEDLQKRDGVNPNSGIDTSTMQMTNHMINTAMASATDISISIARALESENPLLRLPRDHRGSSQN